jgi:aminopeptidase N
MRRITTLLSLVGYVALALTQAHGACCQDDPRVHYDVKTYRLDLEVDPQRETIEGKVAIEVRSLVEDFDTLVLDLADSCHVRGVALYKSQLDGVHNLLGSPLKFEHSSDLLICRLGTKFAKDKNVTVVVDYDAAPKLANYFSGFHWKKTADNKPWVNTSCQLIGAHTWWPCKSSFFHPEDKAEGIYVNLTVPVGLYAVSNGRLTGRRRRPDGKEVFGWRHEYPLETYAVTLNVAPFVVVEHSLELSGHESPVPFIYYVLPEHKERARTQFAQVPELLEIYSEAFGPFPFPNSKVGIVETPFLGMEHSTAIAYGSSFPAWRKEHEKRDPYESMNRHFDYILVHQFAHEWWGNAVSASTWGDFWIHEGFAKYAEGVFIEKTKGREAADRFFHEMAGEIPHETRLFVGQGLSADEAYSTALYYKGASVLNTMRHYLGDDEVWWQTLREFQSRFRYANAGTPELRDVIEELSGREWDQFFEEWVYGSGMPRLMGRVERSEDGIEINVLNVAKGETNFHVPLDLAWKIGDEEFEQRVMLDPGPNETTIEVEGEVTGLRMVNLHRVLGRHRVKVQ